MIVLFKEPHFYSDGLPVATRCAIRGKERALGGKAVSLNVRLDSSLRSAQFLAIRSVARIAKARDPLMGVHL